MALSRVYAVTVRLVIQDAGVVVSSSQLSVVNVTGVGLMTGPVGPTGAKGDTGATGARGATGGIVPITVSTTAPSSPGVNDLWIDIS